MNDFHSILKTIRNSEQKCAIATILRVDGSAYRKAGTNMLILEDGTNIGLLSGGCLEQDLTCRVADILEQQTTHAFVYDLRAEDDLSWGQGTGCNGMIHVLVEPVTKKLRTHLYTVEKCLDQGKPVVWVKKLSHNHTVTDYLFVTKDQDVFGEWQSSIPEVFLDAGYFHPAAHNFNGFMALSEIDENVYVQLIQPKPRLIIFGAGPDVRPLVTVATRTGFTVTVTDWRPAFCNNDRLPDADNIIQGFPNKVVGKLSLSPDDSVIIMTHHFQRDQEILQLLKGYEFRYLGILGPRQRTSRLFRGGEIPDGIHSPIGLSIGAEGPEEIAISILAELIQTMRKANHLNKVRV